MPITRHDGKEGQKRYSSTLYLSTWGWVINAMHRPLYPHPKSPETHCRPTGDWGGLGWGLDSCGISRHHRGVEQRTVQPVAGSYPNYANPAACMRRRL
jgi:hypothetical protein